MKDVKHEYKTAEAYIYVPSIWRPVKLFA